MKNVKVMLFVLVVALLGSTIASFASEAVYYPSTGKVTIPQLTVDGDPQKTFFSIDLQQRDSTSTFDLAGVSLALTAPENFTSEWLSGKTLYRVTSHIQGRANNVVEYKFRSDNSFVGSDLSMSGPWSTLVFNKWKVDDQGMFYLGRPSSGETIWTSGIKVVCGSTARYIKTHDNGSAQLYYFDKNDALSAAEFLTSGIQLCPTTP